MAITKIGTDIIANDAITADKIAAGALDTQLAGYLSTNSFATESYVGTAISNLVDSSPATLDTLNELAAALGDDPNFATTTATAIGLKAPIASPSFTGAATFSGLVAVSPASGTAAITFTSTGAGSEVFSINGQIPGVSNTGFAIRNVTDSRNDLTIDGTGAATFSGTVNGLTLAPSASGNRWGVTAEVASNGVMEVGRYIDFHSTDGDTSDYGARLDFDGTNLIIAANTVTTGAATFSGNVGIGTNAPDTLLHVNGQAKFENNITLNENTPALVIPNGDFRIFTGGAEKVRIDANGKVGIGTNAPPAEGLTIRREGSGKQTLLQLDRPNTVGLQTNIKFSVSDIMVGQIQHEYVASNYNHMSFTLRSPSGADVIPLWLENSGNVGIGTTNPTNKFGINRTSIDTNERMINLYTGTTGPGKYVSIGAQYSENNALSNSEIRFGNEVQSSAPSFLAFATGNTSTPTERMRIDSSGNLSITGNVTAPTIYTVVGGSPNMYIRFDGLIMRAGSSLRYKNTVNDATHGLAELLTLRPVTYKSNSEGDLIYGGLIAEEVYAAGLPEFVQYDQDGEPDGLSYGNMVSLCIKAIQEQQTIIQEQQALTAALTARIEALEGDL